MSADGADVALQMAFGFTRDISPDQASALESVTGLRTRARNDSLTEAPQWLSGETSADLTRLARAWSLRKMRQFVAQATSVDLEQVRPFARALALDFPAISRANDVVYGRNFAGSRLFRALRSRPDVAVAFAIFLGRMGLTRAMDALSAAVAEGREITRTMTALGEYYVAHHPEQRAAIRAHGIHRLAARGEVVPLSPAEQATVVAIFD